MLSPTTLLSFKGGITIITLCDANDHPAYPLLVDPNSYRVTHKYDGQDTVEFDTPVTGRYYQYIQEESRIIAENNIYSIKSIQEAEQVVTVTAQVDLDDWKSTINREFKPGSMAIGTLVNQIKPNGWTVESGNVQVENKSLELENVTPYDILFQAAETYKITYLFDAINKVVTIINPELSQPSGEYVTDELNLKQLTYTGDSTELVTRLYAYGKDGLTFADINDQKEYVENHSYSDKIIAAIWEDDRYTDAQSLKDAATKKLEEMCIPTRSYECSVVDLAKTNSKYSHLAFAMHKTVTLIDRNKRTRINHRVVEYAEYPMRPENNVVTLSTTQPAIENTIKDITSGIDNPNSEFGQKMQNAIQNATNIITGAKGGNVVIKYDDNGKPTEILIMDTDDQATAKKVWRWNIGGFGYSSNGVNGPYTTAITMDGAIVANFITTGTLSADRIYGGMLQSENGSIQFDLVNNTLSADGITIRGNGNNRVYFTGQGEKSIYMASDNNQAVFMYLMSHGGQNRIGMYNDTDGIYIEPGKAGGAESKVVFRGLGSTSSQNQPCRVEIVGDLVVNGVSISRSLQALSEANEINLEKI